MSEKTNRSAAAITALLFIVFFFSCSVSENISTPQMIGEKSRTNLISGGDAAKIINRLHGLSVAAPINVIAEYDGTRKDLLYISFYADVTDAEKTFGEMMHKIAKSENGPFFHLVTLTEGGDDAFLVLGMGAAHYVYYSGHYIIWLQTYQSFHDKIPDTLTAIYPLKTKAKTVLVEES